MVKLGFIVEGDTEKIILEHSGFFGYLGSLSIAYIPEVINAGGNGNLLPHNINAFTKVLEGKGATHIFILTDLDTDECITHTRSRIAPLPHHIVTVSVKTIEAWFLADTETISRYFEDPEFIYDNPEAVSDPFEEIKSIRKAKTGRGFTDKKVLANSIVRKHNFSIQRAAQHPNCSSAKYFLKMINGLEERIPSS